MADKICDDVADDGLPEPELILKTLAVRASFRSGFTLTEMLTTIAVLLILMAIIFSMMGLTFRLTDSTTRGGDSSTEARQVLDRIGEDVAGMLIRPDVDQYYLNAPGNDQMFFYSETAGYFDGTSTPPQQSPLSLVGYRISTSANPSLPPVLERITQGLTWAGANALPFLVFPPRTSVIQNVSATAGIIPTQWSSIVNDGDTAASFWHTIGGQVFRLEICYQLRDGTFTLTAPTPSKPPALSTATTTPTPVVAGSINDTVGLVVAIAVIDSKSRKIIPTTSWTSLIAALPDPSASDLSANPAVLMDSTWNAKINSPGFAQTAGIPVTAATQVRIYQRYYPLNAPLAH